MVTIYALYSKGQIFYIGQTIDLKKRIAAHIKNPNIPGFTFQTLEVCEDSQALKRERYYIKKYVSNGAELLNKIHAKDNRLDDIDKQILQLLADGILPHQMAERLWLSNRTIETRIQRIKTKMKAKHIGGLMYKAFKAALVH